MGTSRLGTSPHSNTCYGNITDPKHPLSNTCYENILTENIPSLQCKLWEHSPLGTSPHSSVLGNISTENIPSFQCKLWEHPLTRVHAMETSLIENIPTKLDPSMGTFRSRISSHSNADYGSIPTKNILSLHYVLGEHPLTLVRAIGTSLTGNISAKPIHYRRSIQFNILVYDDLS